MNDMERETGTVQAEPAWSPLFNEQDAQGFRTRWDAIQTAFVDEPKAAVQKADALVAETMQRLSQGFADERAELERQWGQGSDVSTEDLRQSFKRYRSFFERLLSI